MYKEVLDILIDPVVRTTKSCRNFWGLIRAATLLAVLCLTFGYGVGVGFYHWPPFFLLKDVHALFGNQGTIPSEGYLGEKEILRLAFTDPVIQEQLVYGRITSVDGIYEANRSLMLPVELFFDAYDHLRVTDAVPLVLDQGTTKLLKVTYELGDNKYQAYAYLTEASEPVQGAALVIPGSGLNQSSAIYKNDPSNYHFGIMEALGSSLDKYVLVKPNEDCLAFHDGKAKLNKDFFINWLLDQGASYSAHYIANSVAVTKYLQSSYGKVVVAGLSQGGAAALLNALQSEPDAVIIAAGFSILNARVDWSSHAQIIIPGLQKRLGLDDIQSRIQHSKTRFLFTWGRKEEGTYKMEAEEQLTCSYFSSAENVSCKIHKDGHLFPKDIIEEFLIDVQGSASRGRAVKS